MQIKLGIALFEGGDSASALVEFDSVYEQAGDPATKATANLLAGRSLEAQGEFEAAYDRYLDSVFNFPNAYDSYVGLITLVGAGVRVDEFQRGLVDFNAGAYQPAVNAFTRLIEREPTALAYYYRGLSKRGAGDSAGAEADLQWAVGAYPDDPIREQAWLELALTQWAYLDRPTEAVDTYLRFASAYPTSPSTPEALFNAGRSAALAGDLPDAAEIWLRVPMEYPSSAYAHLAAFRAGIILFRLDNLDGAGGAFQSALSVATESDQRASSQLWMGKILAAQGDTLAAQEAWQSAAAADPTGYYSIRAEDMLAARAPFEPIGVYGFTTDSEAERREAEVWLRATFPVVGPEPLSELDERLANDPRMIRALEFWRLGLFSEAKAELDSLRKEVENDAEATYRLMHTLLELELYQPAIFAARQILRLAGMDDAATMQAPVYFNHIRFAPYFGDLILPEALATDLDGLLLLSVVRQESLFEGFATSFASARGLMQVIPSTGEEIAGQLGWPADYTQDDLYRPNVSVKFGSYYLARQRDLFEGDFFAALAAYNGGPGNTQFWKSIAPDDPDLFLEIISLPETYRYVTTIYEVYKIYQSLYASD